MEDKRSTKTVAKLVSPDYQRKLGTRLEGIFRSAWRWNTGISDRIVVGKIQEITKKAQARIDEGITARSFFDTERMTSEVEKAKEMGLSYQETVAGSKGAWCEEVAIKPDDEKNVLEAVAEGLFQSQIDNEAGLKEIFNEFKDEVDFEFKDRHKDTNILRYRNLIACHRGANGNEYKDWNQVINFGDQKTKAKIEKRKDETMFDIVTINYGEDADRKLDEMIDSKNVAKVILFKNKDGKVDKLEFWFGHFYCDEPEGTRIVNTVFSATQTLKEDRDRDLTGYGVNRKRQITKKNGDPVYLFDADASYIQGSKEKEFNGTAAGIADMNQSVYYSASWLLDRPDQKSAYVCVSATESSALQFSLLTRPEELNFLKGLIDLNDLTNRPHDVYEFIVKEFPKARMRKVLTELKSTGSYQREEIKFAQEGESLINMLGVYTPEDAQKQLSTVFKAHGEIVAGGAFQVSKVTHKDKQSPVQNQIFKTAGNLTTEHTLAIKSSVNSTIIDLRVNTDEVIFNEAKRRMGLMGYTDAVIEDFEPVVGLIVKEQVTKYRKTMATSSYLIQAAEVLNDGTIVTDKLRLAKIKELNFKYLKVIREIDGVSENQPNI